jgi:hypothetical protein
LVALFENTVEILCDNDKHVDCMCTIESRTGL